MKYKEVKNRADISKGDSLIITHSNSVSEIVKVDSIRVGTDGVEIVLDEKKNRFFNFNMYLEGISWVDDVKLICL